MVKRTHEMGKAGLSIPAVLKENKLLTPFRFFQAKRDWSQIIGKQIAKYSYIKDVDKNCVIIGVLNPVWMNQLFMYSQEIQKKLNDYIGEDFVQSVRFVRSGKKPAPVVYETLEGEEESDYPRGRIRDVVLSDDYVPAGTHPRKDGSPALCPGKTAPVHGSRRIPPLPALWPLAGKRRNDMSPVPSRRQAAQEKAGTRPVDPDAMAVTGSVRS